jgi:single-stranded DNA-binding protein
MVASVNRVILLGTISKHGVEVSFVGSGTAKASFTLVLSEQGSDGKLHETYINCECWGKKAEAAGDLVPGQSVVFEGKLSKRKKGEIWEMIVSGFEVVPVHIRATQEVEA